MPARARLIPVVLLALAATAADAALPIQEWRTANGARVLFVETRDLPMLDVSVDFPAGFGRDTRDASGTAGLTLRLMQLGARGLDEDRISERYADVGAQPSGRFDADRAGLMLRTLSSGPERTQALDVMARILQEPTFPEAVLEREKSVLLAGLREADTKPETLADREFRRLVFGDHPYGLRSAGEPETVARITRDDLVAFYRRHYVADTAVVSIIGDVSGDEARTIADQLTRGLGKSAGALPGLPPVPPLATAVVARVAHPATQAHILIGQPGIRRKDPDYFPLWLGNYVLGGGGFASRLSEEIRQKRGFAYSTYSYFNPLACEGQFQVGLQTKKEQSEEALALAREVIAAFVEQGPTQQELDNARQNVIGGFPLRIDSNRKILDYLAVIGFYDLPLDYLDQFPAKIEAVTLDQVRDAWKRRMHPDRMATVVVAGTGER
ncbi:MAG TPA: pitrilysin family protein [Burkholderiales bacterium]|jgi:zinc protease|nr:pitrilysin family protein [Burkholderiales bacterium]